MVASENSSSSKPIRDPTVEYEFVQATDSDVDVFVSLCLSDFIKVEPHSRALGLTPEDSRDLFHFLISKSLHYPYSVKVIERKTGNVVGMRTMSVGHRDGAMDWEPYDFNNCQLSERMKKLVDVLNDAKGGLWQGMEKNVQKVLRREVSLVLPAHQRKGIARHMAEFGLDLDRLRQEGFDGIVSEAFSMANQQLLLSQGFRCIMTPKYDWNNKLDDGTQTVMALFKDIREKQI